MGKFWNERPLPPLYRKRTGRLERWSNCARIAWMKLREWPQPVIAALPILLVMLCLSVMGCSSLSVPPSEAPRNPKPPQISTELPSQSYSESVAQTLRKWQERLTGTPRM